MSNKDDSFNDNLEPSVSKGIKLNNKKSMVKDLPKKVNVEEFVKKATEANTQLNEYAARGAELAAKFKKVLDDKTLAQNKTLMSTNVESDLIIDLANLGIEMNADPHEQVGGSIGLIALLLRSLMIQRDKINEQDFKLNDLKNKLNDLTKELKFNLIDIKK